MESPGDYQTTESDFDVFCRECTAWADKLNLRNWYIDYQHNDDDPDCRAFCQTSPQNRMARITLTQSWDIAPHPNAIKQTAFHEIVEILLAMMMTFAMTPATHSDDIVASERHSIIRTLESAFFEPLT